MTGAPPWRAAVLRLARLEDLPAIVALQADAWRRLGRSVYTQAQIEAFIGQGTMHPGLIDSGRYYVVEHQAIVLGCAGWCLGDVEDRGVPTALVRAVYVHPDWARCGLGSLLMKHVHTMAEHAGCQCLRLTATLMGVPLYRKIGYAETAQDQWKLPGGISLPVRHMARPVHDRVTVP
jgi:GNAT superfamily N-acetyltransferase